MVTKKQTGAESPLRIAVEGKELVIRVGINHLDGNDHHPRVPELWFDNRAQWVKDVIREIDNEDEQGATPLSLLLDACMIEAIEQGSTGLTEGSPTHIGKCVKCGEHEEAVRHTIDGELCNECYKPKSGG